MQVHVGTDTRGVVHSLTTTGAAQADITQLPHLLTGDESDLYGDNAYYKQDHEAHWQARGGRYRVKNSGKRTKRTDAHNAARSRVRARCEHVFHVVKRLSGFTKVRYRGLVENTVRVFAAFALASLYLMRKRLAPHGTSTARSQSARDARGVPHRRTAVPAERIRRFVASSTGRSPPRRSLTLYHSKNDYLFITSVVARLISR